MQRITNLGMSTNIPYKLGNILYHFDKFLTLYKNYGVGEQLYEFKNHIDEFGLSSLIISVGPDNLLKSVLFEIFEQGQWLEISESMDYTKSERNMLETFFNGFKNDYENNTEDYQHFFKEMLQENLDDLIIEEDDEITDNILNNIEFFEPIDFDGIENVKIYNFQITNQKLENDECIVGDFSFTDENNSNNFVSGNFNFYQSDNITNQIIEVEIDDTVYENLYVDNKDFHIELNEYIADNVDMDLFDKDTPEFVINDFQITNQILDTINLHINGDFVVTVDGNEINGEFTAWQERSKDIIVTQVEANYFDDGYLDNVYENEYQKYDDFHIELNEYITDNVDMDLFDKDTPEFVINDFQITNQILNTINLHINGDFVVTVDGNEINGEFTAWQERSKDIIVTQVEANYFDDGYLDNVYENEYQKYDDFHIELNDFIESNVDTDLWEENDEVTDDEVKEWLRDTIATDYQFDINSPDYLGFLNSAESNMKYTTEIWDNFDYWDNWCEDNIGLNLNGSTGPEEIIFNEYLPYGNKHKFSLSADWATNVWLISGDTLDGYWLVQNDYDDNFDLVHRISNEEENIDTVISTIDNLKDLHNIKDKIAEHSNKRKLDGKTIEESESILNDLISEYQGKTFPNKQVTFYYQYNSWETSKLISVEKLIAFIEECKNFQDFGDQVKIVEDFTMKSISPEYIDFNEFVISLPANIADSNFENEEDIVYMILPTESHNVKFKLFMGAELWDYINDNFNK